MQAPRCFIRERARPRTADEGRASPQGQFHDIAGDKFRRLFITVKSYQLAENFRAEAAAILPEPKATALVAFSEKESAPRVSFEAASLPLAAAPAA